MFKRTLSLITALVFLASTGFAQTQQSPGGQAEDISMTAEGYVSLDFREADIRNVFKVLSFKSGVNIVAGPEVTGTVSIQLNNVPWKQALDVILQTYGYAYEQKGNIIIVTTVENLRKRREDAKSLAEQEPLETRTYTLNFGKAAEIISSVQLMKSDRGTINKDDRTNTIIVTDTASRQELMASVINTLDTTTHQVLIEAKIVETQFSDQENLGIDWITQASARGAARATTYPFTNSSEFKYFRDNFPAPEDEDFTFGTINFSQFQAVLEFLKTRSDTDILSSPRIVTTDNKPARITVGSQYPIPQYTYNREQAELQVSGWEYMDIGIIFDVTPHVNDAGFITLDVEPRITDIIGLVTVENTSLPELSNESVKTSVMVKDGDTLVIGGLVKTKTIDRKKRTPFLGDIPIVGYVFRKSEVSSTKTDLIIFITPHIITPKI